MKQRKMIVVFIGLLLLAVSTSLVIAAPGAFEPDTGFEVDGNIVFDDEGGQYDWWNGVTNRPGYPPAILIADAHSKNVNDDYFSPSGKFDEPENWSIKEGSVGPGQNELTNVFVWAVAPGDVGNTDTWLIMGMERVKKSGTFALDFEFNQEPWGFGSLPHTGGPVRTPGDLAVGFELKGNPTSATEDLQVLIVQFYGPDVAAPEECENTYGNGNKLELVVPGDFACEPYGDTGWYYRFLADAEILAGTGLGTATMNAENEGFTQYPFTPNGETYQSYDPQGAVDDYVGEFEFAEAAINLTAFGLDPGCPGFGSVHAKSRSSLEVGSDLKDLAGPRPLPVNCYIEGYKYLDINGNGTRDAGEPGLNGWEIDLSNDSSTTTANDGNGDPGYYRFNNLADGSYAVSEDCTSQTDWVQTEPYQAGDPVCGDGVYNFNIDIDNRIQIADFGNGYPDIDIAKACTSVVQVGGTIDYSFTITNTGNVNLENVILTDDDIPYSDSIGSLVPDGTASRTTQATAPSTTGSVTNEAEAQGDFGGSTVFATVSDTDTCTTTVVDARITIQQTDTNQVNDPHTFTVTVEKDLGDGSWVAASGVSLTPSVSGVGSITGGTCTTGTTDASGQCTITVNSSSTGTATVNATGTVNVSGVNIVVATNGYGAYNISNQKTWVDARITIQQSDTNKVNDPHTFTVTVEKDLGDGSWVAASGVSLTSSVSGVGSITGGTCTTGTTDASGQCTITVNSSSTGTATVNATGTVNVSGVNIVVATNGYGAYNISNQKTWVDARITIQQSDTNGIGESHTFTVTVEKDLGDGAGFVAASGVMVTPSHSGAGSITGETCTAGTDGSGKCTVTVNSFDAGIATINASAIVDVSGVNIDVATNGYGAYNISNQKTWVDGTLTWIKHDSQGNLLGGATFQVCRTADRFDTDIIPDECYTVIDNDLTSSATQWPDTDPVDGLFKAEDLPLGYWTVAETAAPPGYEPDPYVAGVGVAPDPVILLDTDSTSYAVNYIWINVPNQGCTSGWWKNQGMSAFDEPGDWLAVAVTQAVADYWYGGTAPTGFDGTTGALFRDAFNLDASVMTARGLPADLTLYGAVDLGGGDFNALARQGTSALLNSLSVMYEYSADQVLQDVHDAFISGYIGTLIDDYNTANIRDHSACPSGDTPPPTTTVLGGLFFVAMLPVVPWLKKYGRS